MSQQQQPPNALTNPSPKERFQASVDNIGPHRDMVVSDPFTRAMDFGLMQYANEIQGQAYGSEGAAAVGYKLQGAVEFIGIVKQLAEKTVIKKTSINSNLTQTD